MKTENPIRNITLLAGIFFICSLITDGSYAMADKNSFKEQFDFQFKLYSGETIHELIPTLDGDITNHQEILKNIKYLHIRGVYKGDAIVAYLTINVFSPNNKQVKIKKHHLMLDNGIVYHEVVCLGRTLMATADKNAVIDYEIEDVWFK